MPWLWSRRSKPAMRRRLARRAGERDVLRPGGAEALEGRVLLSSATPAGADFPVNVTTAANQANAASAAAPGGAFLVAWQSGASPQLDVFARLFGVSGEPLGNQFLDNIQSRPAVAADGRGNFIVAWQSSGQDGSGFGVYARRYRPDGAPEGDEFLVNTRTADNQQAPSVAADADGNFVVA